MQVTLTLRIPQVPKLSWSRPKMKPLTSLQRQRIVLLVSLAGVLIGGALIGRWALGVAVIADSVFGIWYALYRDVPAQAEDVIPTIEHVFDRARRFG